MALAIASRYIAILLVTQSHSNLMGFLRDCTQVVQILVYLEPPGHPTKIFLILFTKGAIFL